MSRYRTFYRRHLPHYQPPGATLFVTFRLHGSLPQDVLKALHAQQDALQNGLSKKQDAHKAQQEIFWQLDSALDDAGSSPVWLKNPEVANMVAGAIRFLDSKKYELLAYCIMPNHVHLVITPLPVDESKEQYHPLPDIIKSLKGFTARRANAILGRRGTFWQEEYYDHVVRNQEALERILQYVLYNPVKAGLVEKPEDWPWSYCKVCS
ncbi:transposase [Candidatus Parcubacteria bacterium]|nr:MAG: transposase [Candidatus Parcubacteria bacterium]